MTNEYLLKKQLKIEDTIKIKSGKNIEYYATFEAFGISNLLEIQDQKNKLLNADLDDANFGFFCIENPYINNITFSIKKIKPIKGLNGLTEYFNLPEKIKESAKTKIKRYLTKYNNWVNYFSELK